MGDIVKTQPCPECQKEGKDTAGDNLCTTEEGLLWCYARHGYMGKKGKVMKSKEPKIKKGLIDKGQYTELLARGISIETCKKYGYQTVESKGITYEIANFFDEVGNIVMQKVRKPNKGFTILGDTSNTTKFYGQWLFTPHPDVFVTITEGELDALSVAEVFGCRYPVISVPTGAQSAKRVVQENLDWLNGFKYVVLALDNDKDGRKATEECIKLLEPGKVRIAKWPEKDASDLLQQGKVKELRSCIYDAVEYVPKPVLTGEPLLNLLDEYSTQTHKWPWKLANKTISRINIPALYTIAARPGVGKTLTIHEILRMYISEGHNVGIIALEETRQKVLLKVTTSLTGVDLASVSNRALTQEEKELCRPIADKLVIYDHITYGSDLATIVHNIAYMVRVCKCPIIIFDNMSYSATSEKDERKGIDVAMKALKDSTVKYEYTLFNVGHMKRPGAFDDELEPPKVEDIRGSQGIEMFSDYIIGLHRQTKHEDEHIKNTLDFEILKDRFSGEDTGKKFSLQYSGGKLASPGGLLS